MIVEFSAAVDDANVAFSKGLHEIEAALGRFMIALDPDNHLGYFFTARALRSLGRSNEAEMLLYRAPERWADEVAILSIWASLPMHYHLWEEAIGRWELLMERFPSISKFVYHRVNLLITVDRIEEASAILSRARVDFPDDEPLAGLREALRKRASTTDDLAKSRDMLEHAIGLVNSGKISEAERVFAKGMVRFPDQIAFFTQHAWIPLGKKDWAEAMKRWQHVIDCFPNHPASYMGMVNTLEGSGDKIGADELLTRAAQLFPDNVDVARRYERLNIERSRQ